MTKFLNDDIFMSLKIVFILVNNANHDELPLYTWVHTLFIGILKEKSKLVGGGYKSAFWH